MSALAGATVAVIGAGKMGFAMLAGLARGEKTAGVIVVEPSPASEVVDFCRRHGFELATAAPADAAPADAVALAIKPQTLDAAAPSLRSFLGPQTLVLSILAGKRVADLAARLPASAFVRAMPNTPAAIGRGVTGAFASSTVGARQRDLAQALLSALGEVEWIDDEALMDALTAVSGCGPAYVFLLTECLAEAGAKAGLPSDLALRLARGTVAGAGELLARSPDVPPATLRENVTSPGGVTAAALKELMAADGMRPLFARAIAAAVRRAAELSG